eukprot:2519250-Rhodomonas_salina.1
MTRKHNLSTTCTRNAVSCLGFRGVCRQRSLPVVARTREAAIGVFARPGSHTQSVSRPDVSTANARKRDFHVGRGVLPVSHVTVVRSVLAFVVVHARDPVIRAGIRVPSHREWRQSRALSSNGAQTEIRCEIKYTKPHSCVGGGVNSSSPAPPRVARAREAVVGVGARCVQVTVVRSTGTLIRPGPVHRACHLAAAQPEL